MPASRQVRLARRPDGEPTDDTFSFEEHQLPDLEDGQLLLRVVYLSLDPYMRGRLSDAPSYADPVAVGGVIVGGTVCVVESEGNGRMCTTLPPVLVSVLGIEKVVPRFRDLEVFLQLLPRSSTGERMNPYTSLWTGVTGGDGPQELHVVLLDNGRTRVLEEQLGE